MAYKTFDRKVYFALETTEGTLATPDASTGYVETIDPTYSVTNRVFDRNPTRGSITPAMPTITGTGRAAGLPSAVVEFSFSVEMAGSGTAATAPRWSSLLRACGFTEVTSLKKCITGNMTSAGTPSVYYHKEAISTDAAGSPTVGRIVGDTHYDDRTVYFTKAGASDTVSSGDVITGAASSGTAAASENEAASGVAWILGSGDELGGGNSSSLSIRMPLNSNGDYIVAGGCRGNVEFAFTSGDRVLMNFTFSGYMSGYVDGGTFTPTAEGRPIPPTFVGVSLGLQESTYGVSDAASDSTAIFNAMNINIGNDVTVRESVSNASGYDVAYITGRNPQMTFNPDAVTSTGGLDFWDRFLAGETTRCRMDVGSVTGNKFHFRMPAAQFTGISDGNRDEVQVLDSTTTLTGGDYGSSIIEDYDDTTLANNTVRNPRMGTNNEFVLYHL